MRLHVLLGAMGLGLVAMVVAAIVLPESSDPNAHRVDTAGTLLGAAALSALLFAVIHGESAGFAAPEVIETKGFNMLTAELDAFASAIETRRPFATPLPDIRHGVAVFEAVLQSAASGKQVAIAW